MSYIIKLYHQIRVPILQGRKGNMIKTLKDFIVEFVPTFIQIKYGTHLVNIDNNCEGATALYQVFKDYHFKLVACINNILIVEYIEKGYK